MSRIPSAVRYRKIVGPMGKRLAQVTTYLKGNPKNFKIRNGPRYRIGLVKKVSKAARIKGVLFLTNLRFDTDVYVPAARVTGFWRLLICAEEREWHKINYWKFLGSDAR